MKKTAFVLVMAAVLVLSFSAVAMAKYAGYAYNVYSVTNPTTGATTTPHVGYLSWTGAKALMTANGVPANLQNSPHGGYLSSTTKCAVCHSAHRAASNLTAAGVGAYWKLTPASQACTACHTAWGASPTYTMVEWANPTDGSAGPHSSFNCLGACHASVHGGSPSEYGALVAYNLTDRNDPAIAAAFAAGNVGTATSGSNGGTATYATFDEAAFRTYAYAANGTAEDATAGTGQITSTMRAMATGYTCGAAGCHSSSQFAVNTKGYAELRAGNPAASTTLDTVMTGHITNMPSGCGPCHVTNDNKCAACHDMIGKATNSTAFPHGNRNIVVMERVTNGGALTEKAGLQASGNLWMYAGDATYRDGDGNPTSTATYTGVASRTVVENAAGFHGGTAGDIVDGVCLKCHGYQYWPTHGLQAGGSHGASAALNFATK